MKLLNKASEEHGSIKCGPQMVGSFLKVQMKKIVIFYMVKN